MTGPASHAAPFPDDPHAFRVRPGIRRLIITIDGPAGTGKSSVARTLAKRLGLEFLDTGAMYRAAAALALDDHLAPTDHDAIVARVAEADIRFDWTADPPTLLCNGASVMGRIRHPDVTSVVSPISAIPQLRQIMVGLQRRIADQHPRLVTEGRDQGSVVFPHADVKFYLFASADVRAQRRAEQLRAAGLPADVAQLRDEILQRDRSDSSRRDGPLTCPPDAIRVDTSDLAFDEVVDTLRAHVEQQLDERSKKNDTLTAAHLA